MPTINISLQKETLDEIKKIINNENFASGSEFFRHILRFYKDNKANGGNGLISDAPIETTYIKEVKLATKKGGFGTFLLKNKNKFEFKGPKDLSANLDKYIYGKSLIY